MPNVVMAFGGRFGSELCPSKLLSDESRLSGKDVVSHFVSDSCAQVSSV